MLGSKISTIWEKCFPKMTVCSFLYAFGIREGMEGRLCKGGRQLGQDGITGQLMRYMLVLEGGFPFEGSKKRHFQSVLTQVHRGNGQGLLQAKMNLFLRKLCAWSVTTCHDLPSEEFMVRSPCEVTFCRIPFSIHVLLFDMVCKYPFESLLSVLKKKKKIYIYIYTHTHTFIDF